MHLHGSERCCSYRGLQDSIFPVDPANHSPTSSGVLPLKIVYTLI